MRGVVHAQADVQRTLCKDIEVLFRVLWLDIRAVTGSPPLGGDCRCRVQQTAGTDSGCVAVRAPCILMLSGWCMCVGGIAAAVVVRISNELNSCV
jgi:hypothetical protein